MYRKNVGVIPVFIEKKKITKNCNFRVCACLTKTEKFQRNAVKFSISFILNEKWEPKVSLSIFNFTKRKMEKVTLDVLIKQILKCFPGTFHWAQTLELRGVNDYLMINGQIGYMQIKNKCIWFFLQLCHSNVFA